MRFKCESVFITQPSRFYKLLVKMKTKIKYKKMDLYKAKDVFPFFFL